MSEERELTVEEQKAKEYVDFYYFWLFHYCGRNYRRELNKRLPPHTDHASSEQRRGIAQEIYCAHPISSMHPQFLPGDDCTDFEELFYQDCASDELPCAILEILYEGRPLRRNIEHVQAYGVEILGTNGAHISTDGHLRGSIIARIDLRAPVSSILFELSKLKEAKFESFPNFLDAPQIMGLQGNYLHQRNIVQQTTNSSFAVKDDAARAVGLWFWDAIEGPYAILNNFAEAWKVICGEPVPGILVGDEIPYPEHVPEDESLDVWREQAKTDEGQGATADLFFEIARKDNPKHTWNIPSRDVFARLSYSVSDPSVFRRLYRNTKRCIEACEVLSLKD